MSLWIAHALTDLALVVQSVALLTKGRVAVVVRSTALTADRRCEGRRPHEAALRDEKVCKSPGRGTTSVQLHRECGTELFWQMFIQFRFEQV